MKILIDGHSLSDSQKTGKHFHTISLLRSILNHKKSKQHQFHILVKSTQNFPLKNKRLKILKARPGFKFYFDFLSIQKNYDLIISPTSYIPPLLTSKPSLTFIYDLAVFHPNQFKPNKKAQIIEKILLHRVIKKSHLITMAHSIKNELINMFPKSKSKIDVIPGFSKFSGTKSTKLKQPKNPYILFVGTFEPRKNLLNTLIGYGKCVLQLKKEKKIIPNLILVGGKGWQQQNLSQITKKLNLNQYVKILGYISEKKLSHYYQQALLVTYIPFYEGFGLPIIEAISYQKPVITGNQSTLKEVLGPCGITVNPTDTDQIASSIYKLVTDQHLRHAYQKETLKWSKKYSAKQSADLFYQVLKNYK